MYSEQKIYIGEKCFSPTKGTQQGIVLLPLLFNVYLDDVKQNNPILKNWQKWIALGLLRRPIF